MFLTFSIFCFLVFTFCFPCFLLQRLGQSTLARFLLFMAGLKLFLATVAALLTAGVLLNPCCKNLAEPQHRSSVPGYVGRGHRVQEHYQIHAQRLQGYYESLLAALKADAPDLLPLLEVPKPRQHGYQIVPKIIAGTRSSEERPGVRSSWYSWPWTDELIDSESKNIAGVEAELHGASALNLGARRRVYEKLARTYSQLLAGQQNVDAHIQYNRLWQAAIATDRSGYDRQTVLHDAVLERQALLDALNAPDNTGFIQTDQCRAKCGRDEKWPSRARQATGAGHPRRN